MAKYLGHDWVVNETISEPLIQALDDGVRDVAQLAEDHTSALGTKVNSATYSAGMAAKADLASPAFTGTPTAPTASPGTANTQIASTAFVGAAVSAVSAGSVSDATAGAKGIIQLAGDLGGTAASPTVPGLAGKAPLASPTFTGTPAVPTASAGTSSTQVASTAFVKAAIDALVAGAPGALDTLKEIADQLAADESGAAALTTLVGTKAIAMTTTAVKTVAYTAAANEIVPADASSAAVTVTLPTAPADKARVTVKKIDTSANAVTIVAAGTDVLNKAGGSTSIALLLTNQAATFQYQASNAIWYVVGSDIPLSQLDARFSPIAPHVRVLIYTGGAYPARPSATVCPAGWAVYKGPSQPTDWLANDEWVNNS